MPCCSRLIASPAPRDDQGRGRRRRSRAPGASPSPPPACSGPSADLRRAVRSAQVQAPPRGRRSRRPAWPRTARLDRLNLLERADQGPTIAELPFERCRRRRSRRRRATPARRPSSSSAGLHLLPYDLEGRAAKGPFLGDIAEPLQPGRADRVDPQAERQDRAGLRDPEVRHDRRPGHRGLRRPRVGRRGRAAQRAGHGDRPPQEGHRRARQGTLSIMPVGLADPLTVQTWPRCWLTWSRSRSRVGTAHHTIK